MAAVDRRRPRGGASTSCTIDWRPSTGSRRPAATGGCLSARRIRRAAARSASSSSRVWPSASCRSVRARIRCCSTSAAPAALAAWSARSERASAERLLLKIAIGAATERLYLSYPRLDGAPKDARARAVVLRARRDARDHRPRARSPCARRRSGGGSRREPRVARAARSRSRHRRSRARSGGR